MVIAVDFDGTCVTHEFPEIGKNIGAAPVLRCLAENGHNIILHTMRSKRQDRDILQEAIDWFRANGIPLYGVNENPSQKNWTQSPKVYAHIYIDDAALGIPLVYGDGRPYVDWIAVIRWLLENKLITAGQFVDLFEQVQKERLS